MNKLILGKNIKAATKIEFQDANKTAAAEQSLEIFANLSKLFLTFKSTKASIAVFKISSIKTENIVAIIIKNSTVLQLKIKHHEIINKPHKTCIRKLSSVLKQYFIPAKAYLKLDKTFLEV